MAMSLDDQELLQSFVSSFSHFVKEPHFVSHIRPLHVGKTVPPPYAGIEAHIDTLLASLGEEAPSTLVASEPGWWCSRPGIQLPYRLLQMRSLGKFASTRLSPSLPAAVQREFLLGNCNLLHLHAPNPLGDFCGLRCPSHVPVVMSWHSDIVRQRGLYRLYAPVQRAVLKRAHRIVVATPKHYENSLQLHQVDVEHKVRVIPYGIDFSRFNSDAAKMPLPDELQRWIAGRRVILSVGRHIYYKGYEFLVEAIARVPTDAILLMVGTGPLTPMLRAQTKSLGLEERICFLGEVELGLLARLYNACDLFTLPSVESSEAFGISSAEAMSCGRAVVVCELGTGVNHLNRHGETGLTVPPRDVRALADALTTLLRDDAQRALMGRFAESWVRENFSVDVMKREMLALYRDLS